MKKKIKIYSIGLLLTAIFLVIVGFILPPIMQYHAKKLYEEATTSYKIMYAYDLTRQKNVQSTLYAKSKSGGEELVEYYKSVYDYYKKVHLGEIKLDMHYDKEYKDSLYEEPISIPLPLRFLGVGEEVYLEKEPTKEESVVKVFVFDTCCWGYFTAYIPVINLHDSMPPDSIYKKFLKNAAELPKPSDDSPHYGRPSPYGYYCN